MLSDAPALGRVGAIARTAGAALLALALLNAGLYAWLSPPGARPAPQAQAAPQTQPAEPQSQPAPQAAPAAAPQAQPAPSAPTAPGEPLYSAEFQGTPGDAGWTPVAGEWAVEDGRLVQRLTTGSDLGIGYEAGFSAYRLRVTLRHLKGVGGGVLFNMPRADKVAGAHMARFTDDGGGVFWGYFNDQGVFQGQGFAPTPPAGDAAHTLEVLSGAETYALALDGATIAEGVPLQRRQGGIGMTCSQSSVSFEQIQVLPLAGGPAAAAPTQAPAATAAVPAQASLDGMSSVSGDWAREGDALVQRAGEATDFTTATGVAAERYRLNVTVEFPEGAPADAGGGVIFQMPERESRAGAAMLRLTDGGRGIFWGRYDAGGAFQGAGSAGLPEGDPAKRALTLTVRAGSFDIAVDGKVVAKDVPLEGESGSIGLISFRGPVRFRAFQLALGE